MLRAFTDHPASVGETYFEHLRSAGGFAASLFAAGLACLLHAIFPFACQRSGSRRVSDLHRRMVTARHRREQPAPYGFMADGI